MEIARAQTRDGAHLLDVCVDYVGRDGAADMAEVAGRLATAATLPLVLDSTEPEVIRAGLELLAGRAVVNSVNYEDGDGPDSRIARVMPMVMEHGAAVIALTIDEQGQARTAEWKVAVASRLIEDLTAELGDADRRHHRGLPDVPDRHRPGGDPARRDRDHRGHPRGQAPLPRGADHARRLQRVLRPQPGRPGRAELGVPGRVRPGRPGLGHRARGPDHAHQPDPGRAAADRAGPGLRPAGGTATTRWPGCWSCSTAWTRPRSRRPGPPSWPACRSGSGSSGGSSTARRSAWKPTWTRHWPSGRPWRSSTTCCWTG